ncbi:hypothetical protein OOJ91_31485 [Micromonospora lupini]|uniref:hypothetical protein n=1 Tax=Micromonospora lupini TaxID=285679 RepID=UPI002254EBCA|nr:hypothetical protein [Micromonospora lupini]MCX5070372.1 hypothetical protein [Micromonospora lupini]
MPPPRRAVAATAALTLLTGVAGGDPEPGWAAELRQRGSGGQVTLPELTAVNCRSYATPTLASA